MMQNEMNNTKCIPDGTDVQVMPCSHGVIIDGTMWLDDVHWILVCLSFLFFVFCFIIFVFVILFIFYFFNFNFIFIFLVAIFFNSFRLSGKNNAHRHGVMSPSLHRTLMFQIVCAKESRTLFCTLFSSFSPWISEPSIPSKWALFFRVNVSV